MIDDWEAETIRRLIDYRRAWEDTSLAFLRGDRDAARDLLDVEDAVAFNLNYALWRSGHDWRWLYLQVPAARRASLYLPMLAPCIPLEAREGSC